MCQGIKVSVSGDQPTKTKGSHEVAPRPESQPESVKTARVNPLVIAPAVKGPSEGPSRGLHVPGLG